MARFESSIDAVSVVVRGDFNPAIFSPAWMHGEGLIGDLDYAESEPEVITKDLAVFRCGWLECQVTKDALQVRTRDPDEFERARDVAVGVLATLSHTPVGLLGINREVHWAVDSLAAWHAIGDAIAPKEMWEGVLTLPGMRSVVMFGVRPDDYGGRTQVHIEPSLRIPQGIFVAHNDHYTLSVVDHQPESREAAWEAPNEDIEGRTAAKIPLAASILVEEWRRSMSRAARVFEAVASWSDAR